MMYFCKELNNLPYMVINGDVYVPSRYAIMTDNELNFEFWECFGNYDKFIEVVKCLITT